MSVTSPTRLPGCSFLELPPELLGCILAEIETARALSHLSVTCKNLHAFIERHGYRIFVQSRFPSINLPILCEIRGDDGMGSARHTSRFWKDAAHGLTTLSRNLDRRAFVAQGIRHPDSNVSNRVIGTFRRRRPFGPSMGFVPVIDSYEVWSGGDWASRKEVVAWGEGSKLVVRRRNMGPGREKSEHDLLSQPPLRPRWDTYTKWGLREGVDDITTLSLLLRDLEDKEEILVGRASGSLERVLLDGWKDKEALTSYDTQGMPVRYTTVHDNDKSVAAACLGDHTVAFYPLRSEGENTESYLQTSIREAGKNVRTWSAKFLRKGRVAVGLGRSKQPIHIFDLDQRSQTFERAIEVLFDDSANMDGLDSGTHSLGTSVYSITPLPPSSTSSGAEGDVFLSGAYDAHIR